MTSYFFIAMSDAPLIISHLPRGRGSIMASEWQVGLSSSLAGTDSVSPTYFSPGVL